jgi:hypothetical protein
MFQLIRMEYGIGIIIELTSIYMLPEQVTIKHLKIRKSNKGASIQMSKDNSMFCYESLSL